MLTDIIKKQLSLMKSSKRDYIGASQIGHECSRKIWYEYHSEESLFPDKTKMTFEIGHAIEKVILGLLAKSDVEIVNNSDIQRMELESLGGTPDAIIKKEGRFYILDIKTANDSSFNTFVKKGLKEWSMQYYYQLTAYMGLFGIGQAILFAINKNTSEFHEELIEYDPIQFSAIRWKAVSIKNSEQPPERLNKNPGFYICRGCPFKVKCHGGSDG